MRRRDFLKYTALGSLGTTIANCQPSTRWQRDAFRKQAISRVAVLAVKAYDQPLKDVILRGIKLCALQVKGKRVVLKPNLVEFDPKGVINTNPAVIEAAIDAFRTLGAEVVVAEGPGHRRDNEYLLSASGLYDVVREHKVSYVDLNTDDVRSTPVRSSYTRFKQLYLPETLFNADLLVSMPKMKTHHWAGVTLSMKNLFGIVPGAVYGWPKNILHWQGIDNSILDINSSLPLPRFAIVDGIVGMEGNGPLQGQAKSSGVLIFGDDFVSVDASAARLMKLEPRKVNHLAKADEFLGNLANDKIEQIGEKLESLEQDFEVIDSLKDLKKITG
ncbi:MAG TPA: DUF362 domain-containing protein [Candidatus Binatia bacterium]|nr:DUF362 domain-containing protein [Candidatus Binatia bacterium]